MSQELSIFKTANPVEIFSSGKADDFIAKIKESVLSVVTDVSTASGRDEIRSLASKVAKTKTAFDAAGKELKSEWKKKCDDIDAERRKIWDELETLQHQVRKPLTDFEEAEKLRVSVRENRIVMIQNLAAPYVNDPDADTIKAHLSQLAETEVFDWQEFDGRAKIEAKKSRDNLNRMLADRLRRDAQEAELARLRKEEDDRKQKEREAAIADEAAERAKREAEESAAREKAALEAKQKAETERVARENAEREAALKAEQDRIQREKEQAEARAKKAEEDRVASELKAKADAEAAEKKRLADIEQARKDEEARQQRIKDDEAAELARREADKMHKAMIHNEIKAAIEVALAPIASGETAKEIVIAIASGKIPHVKIIY